MRRLILLLLAALVATGPLGAARAAEPSTLEAATAAFRTAADTDSPEIRASAFAEAARLYEAAAGEIRNGALEYNTANAWLLAGDVGRAVLHYRRALDLRPGDPRVVANLETARARRRDRFDVTSGRALTDTLLFWHRGLSLRSKVPVALAAWALGFGLLAVGVWLPRRAQGRAGARRTGLLLVLAALAVGGSALVELRDRAARDAAVVLADQVVLRTGDGASYPGRYENPIHAGAEVRVLEERAGWARIELPDGKSGWVPVDAVERV